MTGGGGATFPNPPPAYICPSLETMRPKNWTPFTRHFYAANGVEFLYSFFAVVFPAFSCHL